MRRISIHSTVFLEGDLVPASNREDVKQDTYVSLVECSKRHSVRHTDKKYVELSMTAT